MICTHLIDGVGGWVSFQDSSFVRNCTTMFVVFGMSCDLASDTNKECACIGGILELKSSLKEYIVHCDLDWPKA